MAGPVPAIHVLLAAMLLRRGCRVKARHDEAIYFIASAGSMNFFTTNAL